MSESEAMKEKIFIILAKKAALCGLSNISLNDIANEAGIKKPSLYNYWESRDTLIHEFFDFWIHLFTNMAGTKSYLLPMNELLDHDAIYILSYYANRGFSYFSSTPFKEVFVVMDSEKFINTDACELFTILHRTLFHHMREVLIILNNKNKMKIQDLDSATSLLLSSFLEHVRVLSQTKETFEPLCLEDKKKETQKLIAHFVQLYQ